MLKITCFAMLFGLFVGYMGFSKFSEDDRIAAAIVATLGTMIFLIPAYIACWRQHSSRAAILATNIFLGWSGLGWIVALIWSLTGERKERAAN